MRLSLEIGKVKPGEEPCEVEVCFDEEGLDVLISRLDLLKSKKTDHVHLFTPAWGMDDEDLTEDKLKKDNFLVHHMKLNLVDG